MANQDSVFLQLPAELRNDIWELVASSQETALVRSNAEIKLEHPLMLTCHQVHQEFTSVLKHQLCKHATLTATVTNNDFSAIHRFLTRLPVESRRSRRVSVTLYADKVDWPAHVMTASDWINWLRDCSEGVIVNYHLDGRINWYACRDAFTKMGSTTFGMADGFGQSFQRAIMAGTMAHAKEWSDRAADFADRARAQEMAEDLREQLKAWVEESEAASRDVEYFKTLTSNDFEDKEYAAKVVSRALQHSVQVEMAVKKLKEDLAEAEARVRRIEEIISVRMQTWGANIK